MMNVEKVNNWKPIIYYLTLFFMGLLFVNILSYLQHIHFLIPFSINLSIIVYSLYKLFKYEKVK